MESVNMCSKCGYRSDSKFTQCPECGLTVDGHPEFKTAEKEFSDHTAEPEEQTNRSGSGSGRSRIIVVAILILVVLWGWSRINRDSGTGSGYGPNGGSIEAKKISDGEVVDLRAHLSEGKYSVFLFYADW